MLHELKAEPDYMICVSASPLLDLFQKNLEPSAVFGLSMCMATAGNPTVGNENALLEFFLGGKFN
jgi:hypothetical protein